MLRWRGNVELLPVLPDDVLQSIVMGILANQLPDGSVLWYLGHP